MLELVRDEFGEVLRRRRNLHVHHQQPRWIATRGRSCTGLTREWAHAQLEGDVRLWCGADFRALCPQRRRAREERTDDATKFCRCSNVRRQLVARKSTTDQSRGV